MLVLLPENRFGGGGVAETFGVWLSLRTDLLIDTTLKEMIIKVFEILHSHSGVITVTGYSFVCTYNYSQHVVKQENN